MEGETRRAYVLVRIEVPADLDEFDVDEVASEMDYNLSHPDIKSTEIMGISMEYPHGF